MFRRIAVALASIILCSTTALAAHLSAVCSNIVGVRVDDRAGTVSADRDGVSGASWSYSWEVGTDRGTLILQNSKAYDSKPNTEQAFVVVTKDKTVHFISILSGAVWVHSIYPLTNRLLVSQHTSLGALSASNMGVGTSTLEGAISGKMLWGECRIGVD